MTETTPTKPVQVKVSFSKNVTIILGVLLSLSEALSLIPSSMIHASGILELVIDILKFLTGK